MILYLLHCEPPLRCLTDKLPAGFESLAGHQWVSHTSNRSESQQVLLDKCVALWQRCYNPTWKVAVILLDLKINFSSGRLCSNDFLSSCLSHLSPVLSMCNFTDSSMTLRINTVMFFHKILKCSQLFVCKHLEIEVVFFSLSCYFS